MVVEKYFDLTWHKVLGFLVFSIQAFAYSLLLHNIPLFCHKNVNLPKVLVLCSSDLYKNDKDIKEQFETKIIFKIILT